MGIRALVVCHDAASATELSSLLAREADIDGTDLCNDGACATETVARLTPDLVFLDSDLPGVDSFELATSWAGPPPLVAFLSDHDGHARRAFDVRALDYLRQPVDPQRLHGTIARARDQLAWLDAKRHDRIVVKADGRVLLLHRAEIDRVESAGNYLKLHVGPITHLVRHTMAQMERELGADRFVRIHRSHLVNVDRIAELHPLLDGDCTVVLRGGVRLTMSRGYRERLHEHLGRKF